MEDPLNEGTYFRAHRRAERQEKQLRNIERERAQHEKLQVDRLLDELKGQDWIRVLGIHGINDAEKKLYEPKRAFFIHELSLLIEKFNLWRAEEKRRKVDKPFARADTTPPSTAKSHSTGSKRRGAKPKKIPVEDDLTLNGSAFLSDSGDPPDTDDVDACAARQLHQEARSAGKQRKNSSEKRKTTRSVHPPEQPHPGGAAAQTQTKTPAPTPTTFAFGYPVPHMEEREFHLPSDILNEESIQASRRKLRRLKRERRAE